MTPTTSTSAIGPGSAAGHHAAVSQATTAAPVRVLYLLGHFMLGGTERHVLRVLRALDRSRVRPFVGMLRAGGAWFEQFRELHVPYHIIGLQARLTDPRYLPRLLRLARFARVNGIQIVHAYSFEMQMLACPLRVMCPGIKLVGTRRNVAQFHRKVRLHAYGATQTLFSRIVAVSEGARTSAIAREGIDPQRICVIPNGLDMTRFPLRMTPAAPPPLRIGTVANIKKRKGYFWALRGLALLAERGVDFEYHVIGRPDEGVELERLARELGLSGRMRLHGKVPDPSRLAAGFHVFLLPSYYEGMSNALMEAMAVGTPCVATDIPGNDELMRDGVEGFLVRPDDARGLADRLQWVSENPSLAQEVGERARRRVQEAFTVERMVRSMERLYSELVA